MPQFIDYETISDKVCWLSKDVTLCFSVKLGRKDKDGNRIHFHKEYEYFSQYNNTRKSVTIKRTFDYYLSIENSKDRDSYIQIRTDNMIMLQSILRQVVAQLMDDSLWTIKNKALVVKGNPSPILLNALPMNKWISFQIISCEINGLYTKGVRITLGDYSKYVDIQIDPFMGFVYTINTMDMYQCALSIVNYLHWSEYGTNIMVFDNSEKNKRDVEEEPAPKIPVRPKKQKSFFDIDNLYPHMP